MKIIGITGGIGSGKSTVSRLLCEKYAVPVIDADILSKQASEDICVLRALGSYFGQSIFSDGVLDRRALAKIVFNDKDKLKTLNSVIHPKVRELFSDALNLYKNNNHSSVIYDCPLLIEEKLQREVDTTVLVYANDDIRIKRAAKRGGLSEQEVKIRIEAQMSLEEKIKYSDYVIYNNSSVKELENAVEKLYECLCRDGYIIA